MLFTEKNLPVFKNKKREEMILEEEEFLYFHLSCPQWSLYIIFLLRYKKYQ